jgi:hypothetical protein
MSQPRRHSWLVPNLSGIRWVTFPFPRRILLGLSGHWRKMRATTAATYQAEIERYWQLTDFVFGRPELRERIRLQYTRLRHRMY